MQQSIHLKWKGYLLGYPCFLNGACRVIFLSLLPHDFLNSSPILIIMSKYRNFETNYFIFNVACSQSHCSARRRHTPIHWMRSKPKKCLKVLSFVIDPDILAKRTMDFASVQGNLLTNITLFKHYWIANFPIWIFLKILWTFLATKNALICFEVAQRGLRFAQHRIWRMVCLL